jgi:hypothetical protein
VIGHERAEFAVKIRVQPGALLRSELKNLLPLELLEFAAKSRQTICAFLWTHGYLGRKTIA